MVSRSLRRADQPTAIVSRCRSGEYRYRPKYRFHLLRFMVKRVVQLWSNRDPFVTVANRGAFGGDMRAHNTMVSRHLAEFHPIRVPNLGRRCMPCACVLGRRASFDDTARAELYRSQRRCRWHRARNMAQKEIRSRPRTQADVGRMMLIDQECDTCCHNYVVSVNVCFALAYIVVRYITLMYDNFD
jgi:hypothetical protein